MKKILLVDDDELQIDLLNGALNGIYTTVAAKNGKEAVSGAIEFQPDLILLDIKMPIMDGFEACSKIREQGIDIPIIFLSALDTLKDKIKAYDAGGDDYIGKPCNREEILLKIDTCIKHSEKERITREDLQNTVQLSLTDLSFMGQIINFFKKSFSCSSLNDLSSLIFSTLESFGLQSTIYYPKKDEVYFDDQVTKPVELAILSSLDESHRILAFGKNRTIFKWDQAILLIKNMSEDETKRGSMNDYLAYLMDGVEECLNKIVIEQQLKITLANFKSRNEVIKLDILSFIENLEEDLVKEFSKAGLDDDISVHTEEKLVALVQNTRENAEIKLREGYKSEEELNSTLALFEIIESPDKSLDEDVILF